jgi:hypothetical protein
MPEFDSFDDLTSQDPADGALRVMGLPWRVDGRSAEILRDRHDTKFKEVLEAVDRMASGGIDEEVLRRHGITSSDDLQALPDEKKREIAREAKTSAEPTQILETAALLLWAGWVRFEPGLELKQVMSAVDIGSVSDLPIEEMISRLVPSIDDSAPEVEDGDAGKSPSTSSSGAARRPD